MWYTNDNNYESLVRRAAAVYDIEKDYKTVIKLADLAFEIANNENDINKKVWSTFLAASSYEMLENYETALARFTWIISQVEHNGALLNLNDWHTEKSIISSFGRWVRCALNLPLLSDESSIEIIEACERFADNNGKPDWRPELLHTKSIALQKLKLYDRALIAAEEGIALKKMYPSSQGCELDHHLEIYSSLLLHIGRDKDAFDVIDEAIEKYPWQGSFLAEKGYMYFLSQKYDEAIQNYTESIFLNPKPMYFRLRGLCFALNGNKKKAMNDFKDSYRLAPTDIYPAIWLAGINNDICFLEDCLASDKWIANVCKYYLNIYNEDQLINSIDIKKSDVHQSGDLCEAYTFIALKYEQQKNLDKAKYYYNLSINTESNQYIEYIWAKHRLIQMGSGQIL